MSVENIGSVLSEKHVNILQSIALFNSGSRMLLLTDNDIPIIMSVLSIFNAVTDYEISTYVHIYNYSHMKYLDLLRTIQINPPMDIQTYVIKGDSISSDICIYDNNILDIIFLCFTKDSNIINSLIAVLWMKLKCNGSMIIKGLMHDDTKSLHKLQTDFCRLIVIPSTIKIVFQLVEGTGDMIIIKKPCY